MNKRLITYTTLTCATLLAVGATMLGQKSLSIKSYADPVPVNHTIKFTYENVSFFEYDDTEDEYIAEDSKKTEADNTFRSSDITIYSASITNPVLGDSENNYIFKLDHVAYPYYTYSSSPIFIAFEMNLDIAGPVTAIVNRTIHYHKDDVQSNATEDEAFLELDNVDDKHYGWAYEFYFENQYQDYVTINYIEIRYACSY